MLYWTWNTNVLPRVNLTEIVNAPNPTPREEFIKETEKVSPQASKAFKETKSVSSNNKNTTKILDTAWKLLEECEHLSHDIFTVASTQQTSSMSSNKWREPPTYPSSISIQGDREKLAQCIAALEFWVKVF